MSQSWPDFLMCEIFFGNLTELVWLLDMLASITAKGMRVLTINGAKLSETDQADQTIAVIFIQTVSTVYAVMLYYYLLNCW